MAKKLFLLLILIFSLLLTGCSGSNDVEETKVDSGLEDAGQVEPDKDLVSDNVKAEEKDNEETKVDSGLEDTVDVEPDKDLVSDNVKVEEKESEGNKLLPPPFPEN